MALSQEFHDYVMQRKLKGQPVCDTVDRIFHEYRSSDISELSERADNLSKVNDFYLERIHELEKKQQTVLFSHENGQ